MKTFVLGVLFSLTSSFTLINYLPAQAANNSFDIESFKPLIKQVDLLSFLGKPVKIPASSDKTEFIYVIPPQFVFDEDTGQIYYSPIKSIYLASGKSIDEGKRQLVQTNAETVLNNFISDKGPLVEEIRKTLIQQLNTNNRKGAQNDLAPFFFKEASANIIAENADAASRKALMQIFNSSDNRATTALNWLTVNLAYNGVLGATPQLISEKMKLNPNAAFASSPPTQEQSPTPTIDNSESGPQLQPYGDRSFLERFGRSILGDRQYETLFGSTPSPSQTEAPKETQTPPVSPSASPTSQQSAPTPTQQKPYEPPQDQPNGFESTAGTYTRSDGSMGTEITTHYNFGNDRTEIITERDDNTKDIYTYQKSTDGSEIRINKTQYPDGTEEIMTTETNPEKYSRRTYNNGSIEYEDPDFRTMSPEEGQKIWENYTAPKEKAYDISQSVPATQSVAAQNNWRNLTDYDGAKNFFESQGGQVIDGGEGVGITVTDKDGNQSTYPDTKSFIDGANTTSPEYNGGMDLFRSAADPGNSVQAIEDVKLPSQQKPSDSQASGGDRAEDYIAPSSKSKEYRPIDPYSSEERLTRASNELISDGATLQEDGTYKDSSTGKVYTPDGNGFYTTEGDSDMLFPSGFDSEKTRDLTTTARTKSQENWTGVTQQAGTKMPTGETQQKDFPVGQIELVPDPDNDSASEQKQIVSTPIKSDPSDESNIPIFNNNPDHAFGTTYLSPETIDQQVAQIGYDGLAKRLGISEYDLNKQLTNGYIDSAKDSFVDLARSQYPGLPQSYGVDITFDQVANVASQLRESGRVDLNNYEKALINNVQKAIDSGIRTSDQPEKWQELKEKIQKSGNGTDGSPFTIEKEKYEYDPDTEDIKLKDDWDENVKDDSVFKQYSKKEILDDMVKRGKLTSTQAKEIMTKNPTNIKLPDESTVRKPENNHTQRINEDADGSDPYETKQDSYDPKKIRLISGQ